MRKTFAALALAALPFAMLACGDDDDNDIENPDLDPGEGTGLPGSGTITEDLDPGEGTGLPGEDTLGD